MIIFDRLLVGGLKFVLNKVAAAVDEQMNDEELLREELLAAHARLEIGEITEAEFATIERALLARLREIREQREGLSQTPIDAKVTGVEVEVPENLPAGGGPRRR